MSLDTWMRLEEFLKAINENSPASDDEKGIPCETCPPPPRVHVVYAHYGARPRLTKNVEEPVWYFDTLKLYKACEERKWSTVALDFLGSHFLWVLTTGVTIVKLPQPPTVLPIPPTAIDGGTLVHFLNTNFTDQKKVGDDAVTGKGAATGVKQGQTVFATITLPLNIQDKSFVHQHGDVVPEVSHPPANQPAAPPPPAAKADATKADAAKPDGAKAAPKPKQVKLDTPAGPAACPAPLPDIEGPQYYPTLRRLCLSQVGKTGEPPRGRREQRDHDDAGLHLPAAAGGHEAARDLHRALVQLRAPLRRADSSPQKLEGSRQDPAGRPSRREVLANPVADPWKESTRNQPFGKRLWETTSNVYCGRISGNTKLADGNGIDKSTSGEATTTTGMLGDRFIDKIGRSRWLIFKAMSSIEGRCESIQTWDGPKLSWGINQWIGGGELWQILAYIYDFFPDAFARRFGYFGLGHWFSGRKWTWTPGVYQEPTPYRVPCCGTGGNVDIRSRPRRGAEEALLLKPPEGVHRRSPAVAGEGARGHVRHHGRRQHELRDVLPVHHGGGRSRDPEGDGAVDELSHLLQEASRRADLQGARPLPQIAVGGHPRLPPSAPLRQGARDPGHPGGADGQALENKAAAEFPDLPSTPAPKNETPDEKKARVAKDTAAQRAQIVTRSNKSVELLSAEVGDIMNEIFSDDDADEAWCYWPTRLRDAGKVGFGTEDKNLTDISAAASTQKADDAKKPAPKPGAKPAAAAPH